MKGFYAIIAIITAISITLAFKFSPNVDSFGVLIGFNGLLSVGLIGIVYNKFYA